MAAIKISQINHKKIKSKNNWKDNILKPFYKEYSWGSKKLSDKKKCNFYNVLHILLSSGIDLRSTLELMCEEINSKVEKEIYSEIKKSVIEGVSLSEAIKMSNQFSNYECYSIKIGEETGGLCDILKELVIYYTEKA